MLFTFRQLRAFGIALISVYALSGSLGSKAAQAATPTVEQALLAVAALGGHLKRNGPPGWKVLLRGMTRLLDYEAGWRAATGRTEEATSGGIEERDL